MRKKSKNREEKRRKKKFFAKLYCNFFFGWLTLEKPQAEDKIIVEDNQVGSKPGSSRLFIKNNQVRL